MRVLRAKSDSLNAMLEAFVHDPLIGWKLLHAADAAPSADQGGGGEGGAAQRGKSRKNKGAGEAGVDDHDVGSDSEGEDLDSRSASRDTGGGDESENDLGSVTSRERLRRAGSERPRERRRSKSQQFGPRRGGSNSEASSGSSGSKTAAEEGESKAERNSKRKSSKSSVDSAESALVEKKTDAEIEARKLSALLHVSTIEVNEQAMRVTRRIQLKLDGREFADEGGFRSSSQNSIFSTGSSGGGGGEDTGEVGVEEQVDRLIKQARAHENLAQMFVGWCGFW